MTWPGHALIGAPSAGSKTALQVRSYLNLDALSYQRELMSGNMPLSKMPTETNWPHFF